MQYWYTQRRLLFLGPALAWILQVVSPIEGKRVHRYRTPDGICAGANLLTIGDSVAEPMLTKAGATKAVDCGSDWLRAVDDLDHAAESRWSTKQTAALSNCARLPPLQHSQLVRFSSCSNLIDVLGYLLLGIIYI